jgi:pumilio family protein 6
MPPRVGKKRASNSGAFSKGPQSKRFRKAHGQYSKQAPKYDRTKKKAAPFKRKPKPVWKKKRAGEDYKKISNVKKANTSVESTPKEGIMQDKGAKLFRRHKPLAEKKVLSKKERRQMRKKQRENYPIIERSKGKWEALRRHDCNTSDRSKIITELVEATRGHVAELIAKHDTVRVVQCMLQYGTAEQRSSLFGEIKDSVKDLVKQKYAKHLILKILKYGTPSQRSAVMTSFHGSVCKLVKHTEASSVLETAYNDYATAQQRSALHLEFYGSQYAHFKPPDLLSLSSVLTSSNTSQKKSVMKYIKSQLLPIVDKPALKHSIVHHVLLEYLSHAEEEDRAEMIELVRERLVEIVHTRDGARATMHCIWHGTPKDRKAIVKSFKGFVKKICYEEHGFLVLLALFDSVDDTVLIRKAILSEILSELEEVTCHPNGCRLVLYLLSPRSPEHFKKSFCALLEPGDNNKHSKKSPEVRHSELLEAVSPSLVPLAQDKLEEWIRDKHLCHLLIEVIFNCKGDISEILNSILNLVKEDFTSENHIITDPVGHFVVKRIVMKESKQFETEGLENGEMLSEMIVKNVESEVLREWATTNRGAFVLCSMVLSKVPGVSEGIAGVLKSSVQALKAGELKGQQALVNDLQRTFHK